MGYRSTFVTEDIYMKIPDWFFEKYKGTISFGTHKETSSGIAGPSFPLASLWERKFYNGAEEELFIDIAKVLSEREEPYVKSLTLALMHEDGIIDRVIITPREISIHQAFFDENMDMYNPQLGDRKLIHIIEEKK